MVSALISHSACLEHINPPGHPEQVARLEAILTVLERAEFNRLLRVEAPLADVQHLRRIHPPSYIDLVRHTAPKIGFAALDPDTSMSPRSFDAALRAVGANIHAVDLVMQGQAQNAFCAIRPPGHHAEAATAMGFCLFGNVAAGAQHALQHWGLERVAVVDFDVHHGNGTQAMAWNVANFAYVSTHQSPLYPGTGAGHDRGASGNILNLPLPPNSGSKEFRARMQNEALPFLKKFKPQFLFISAGFDAHRADPLANLNLTEDDFSWVTLQLCDLADRHCHGRIVSTLEGGYDLDALAASTAAHVRVLMERGA